MNLKSAFALLAAGSFLVACGSDEVVNVNDEAKEKATITLKVVDNHDGSAISGASVYSVVDDKTRKSDKLGLSVWKSQVLGTHAYEVSMEGYATILTAVDLVEQGQGNVARVGDVIQKVEMYKTGVTAKGTVLYTDDKGNKKAVKDAVVYASLPDKFVPSEFSTKTNANGEYTFSDLPEGVRIGISVGQLVIDKMTYAGITVDSIGGPSYRAGDIVNANIINMGKVAKQVVLTSSNLEEADTASTLTFTFSADLADSSKKAWSVKVGSSPFATVVTVDKKTVSIKPAKGGKWQKNTSYTISGTVYSTEGISYTMPSTSFSPGAGSSNAPDQVGSIKAVDGYDDDEIDVTWTAPKSAFDGYHLYFKTNSQSTYTYYSSYGVSSTTTTLELGYSGLPLSATSVSVVVVPYKNVKGVALEADFEKAPVAEWKKTAAVVTP